MNRHQPAAAVPCGICCTRITAWTEPADGAWIAHPCGHTLTQHRQLVATYAARRVHLGANEGGTPPWAY